MPDVQTQAGGWSAVNNPALQLPVGAALRIQNKGPVAVTIQEHAGQPPTGDTQGWLLQVGESIDLDAGSPGAWALSVLAPVILFVQRI